MAVVVPVVAKTMIAAFGAMAVIYASMLTGKELLFFSILEVCFFGGEVQRKS